MKKLEFNEMEKVEGGGIWWAIGCLALGMATGPVVGIACELLNPAEAY